jgi:hypothetical protein
MTLSGWHYMVRNKGKYLFTFSWIVLLTVLLSTRLNAQYVEVLAEFDTNQVRIGEVFHLNLSVEQPADLKINFPIIKDTLVDKVELVESLAPDTTFTDDILRIQQTHVLTCFDSGLYEIPPLVFEFSAADWSDSISTYPLYLMVHTVAVDSAIYDIKAPIHVPVGVMEVLPYVAGGLAFIAAVLLLIWYLRKRKKGETIFTAAKPEEPAHIIALRELDELKNLKLWQQSEFKEYYSILTGIVRKYLERRYSIQAMEMTSTDIMRTWKASGEEKEDLSGNLNMLLNLADLVKFAKEKPIASDNEENMDRAYDFIHKTKQVKPLFGEEPDVLEETEKTTGDE